MKLNPKRWASEGPRPQEPLRLLREIAQELGITTTKAVGLLKLPGAPRYAFKSAPYAVYWPYHSTKNFLKEKLCRHT